MVTVLIDNIYCYGSFSFHSENTAILLLFSVWFFQYIDSNLK